MLEAFINHEIVTDLRMNGLKYLVVTFCIVYDLQKMLGCASFTLEMQIKKYCASIYTEVNKALWVFPTNTILPTLSL